MTPQHQDRRRQTLTDLLDHWRDFYDEPTPNGHTNPDDDTRASSLDWSLFSSMARSPSVVEMRRCVELLERLGRSRTDPLKVPAHHRHLMAYTAYVEWRLVDAPIKRRDARGRWVDDVERVRERVVPSWVNPRMVESALDMLLGLWDRRVSLELPPALALKLRPLADADGWTEAAA